MHFSPQFGQNLGGRIEPNGNLQRYSSFSNSILIVPLSFAAAIFCPFVFIDGNVFKVKRIELTGRKKTAKKEGDLNSPISGTVVSVKVKEGGTVKKDEVVMIIEAMKMEYLIRAPYEGVVKKVHFKEKDQIEIGQITVELEDAEE